MRVVNEASIEMLLAADLVIREDVVWSRREPTDRRVRLRLAVANRLGEPLWLHMHVPIAIPWQYSFALVWRKLPIRRLDVRGSHVNQCDGSGERWQNATHKQQWRDPYRDHWAYTPEDIPPTPALALGPDEYRRVFEAFCEECAIRVQTAWVDPDLQGPIQDTMGGAS